jgi:hypothetical protein
MLTRNAENFNELVEVLRELAEKPSENVENLSKLAKN